MRETRGRVRLAARREGGRRPLPIVFAFVGIVVVTFAQAVERGMIDGVKIEWPVYLFGGAMIAIGIFGMARRNDPEPVEDESGPIRESGRAPNERDPVDELRETLDRMQGRKPWDTTGSGPGGGA